MCDGSYHSSLWGLKNPTTIRDLSSSPARRSGHSAAISAPQHVVKGISTTGEAITVIAIRKIAECGIKGEPIPNPDAIDNLGLWQALRVDELQEFRS
jgi:hypothetical protein